MKSTDSGRTRLDRARANGVWSPLTADRAVRGLTILAETPGAVREFLLDGRPIPAVRMQIEGHRRDAVVLSLTERQRAVLTITS